MKFVVLGIVLFFAVHSVPMVPRLRAALIARLGENGWKGVHTLFAVAGLVLMVWGVGEARYEGGTLWWERPKGMRHAVLLVLLPVFPLLAASSLPGWISARTVHPMLTGVILWAVGHLLYVGFSAAVVIFVAFAVWGIADRVSLAFRKPGPAVIPPFGRNDVAAIVIGLALYGLFLWKAHLWLIGVSPLG